MTAGAEVLLFLSLGLSFHCNLPEAPLGAIPLVPGVSTEGITICFSATRVCIATRALKVLYISLGNRSACILMGDRYSSHIVVKAALHTA